MRNKERAELLAAGEKSLAFWGKAMEEAIRDKDLSLARVYRCRYDGAVYMLETLGLLSHEECENRSSAIFARFMETAFPKPISKEDI